MLWYKTWRETRWRGLMPLAVIIYGLVQIPLRAGPHQSGRGPLMVLPIFWLMVAIFLGGSGVKTEPVFQPMKGLHGSMYFTLALPVSRLRLIAVRAGFGMLETAAIILPCAFAAGMLPELSGHAGPENGLRYALTVLTCATGFFGLSTLLSTVLDQIWQIWGGMAAIFLSQWLFNKFGLPQSFNIFQAMGNSSPLVAPVLPWAAMCLSLCLGAAFFLAAIKVVQTREF